MKFKKGDLVEVIWRSELYRGAVTRLVEATDEMLPKLANALECDIENFFKEKVSKTEILQKNHV